MKTLVLALAFVTTLSVVAQPSSGPYPVPGGGGGGGGGSASNALSHLTFTNQPAGVQVFVSDGNGGTNEAIGTNGFLAGTFVGPTNGFTITPGATFATNVYVAGKLEPDSVVWTTDSLIPRYLTMGSNKVFAVEDADDQLSLWYYNTAGTKTAALINAAMDAGNIVQGTVPDLNLSGNVLNRVGFFGSTAFNVESVSAVMQLTNLNGNFIAASNIAIFPPPGTLVGYVLKITNATTGQGTWSANPVPTPAQLSADIVYTTGPQDVIGTQSFLRDIAFNNNVWFGNGSVCFSNWATLPDPAGSTKQNFIGFSNGTPYVINNAGTNPIALGSGGGGSTPNVAYTNSPNTFFNANVQTALAFGTSDPGTHLIYLFANSAATNDQMVIQNSALVDGVYANFWLASSNWTYQIGIGGTGEAALGVADKFFIYDRNRAAMILTIDSNGLALFQQNLNNFGQPIVVQNLSSGNSASGEISVRGDTGTSTNNFISMGYNSSRFNNSALPPTGTNEAYILVMNNSTNYANATNTTGLTIAIGQTNSSLKLSVGNGLTRTNLVINDFGLTLLTGSFVGQMNATNIIGLATNNYVIVNTNFNTGQLYTNNYGAPALIAANAILTTAGVVGQSQLALVVVGSITNYSTVLSAIGGLTGSMTNALTPAMVPNGATYYFTNTSSTGDAATVYGGQIYYANPISAANSYSGSFTGNGGGLTNLTGLNLVGPISPTVTNASPPTITINIAASGTGATAGLGNGNDVYGNINWVSGSSAIAAGNSSYFTNFFATPKLDTNYVVSVTLVGMDASLLRPIVVGVKATNYWTMGIDGGGSPATSTWHGVGYIVIGN